MEELLKQIILVLKDDPWLLAALIAFVAAPIYFLTFLFGRVFKMLEKKDQQVNSFAQEAFRHTASVDKLCDFVSMLIMKGRIDGNFEVITNEKDKLDN